MIRPIVRYGDPVLRQETVSISENTETLQQLIDDMIETMHGAQGIGLAAPQIGQSLRLFVVDISEMTDAMEEEGIEIQDYMRAPMVFINPQVVAESEEEVEFEEGCLSIPDIRENVYRPFEVTIQFLDRNFQQHELIVDEFFARVIQHEYDHIEGILFTDLISPFKKRLLKRRLREISKGNIDPDYPMVLDKYLG